MKCPYCESVEDKVVDSRSNKEENAIRRRRECLSCGRRFTTYEYVELYKTDVIKSDGRREPFIRDKVFNGIRIACTKRSISITQMEDLVDAVELEIRALGEREVSTKVIGELVISKLKDIDEVAYVRFASVYRDFKDKGEFLAELRKMGEVEDQFYIWSQSEESKS